MKTILEYIWTSWEDSVEVNLPLVQSYNRHHLNIDKPHSGKGVPNSLPNEKALDRSKLRAFADNKINVINVKYLILGRVENFVEKGENAGSQYCCEIYICDLSRQNLPYRNS